jgi:hypothetical protein
MGEWKGGKGDVLIRGYRSPIMSHVTIPSTIAHFFRGETSFLKMILLNSIN